MRLKKICWRLFCCKRKQSDNLMDQLESQYEKESDDMKRKEKLLHLDTEEIAIIV